MDEPVHIARQIERSRIALLRLVSCWLAAALSPFMTLKLCAAFEAKGEKLPVRSVHELEQLIQLKRAL